MGAYQNLSKFEIAQTQLERAIDLYLSAQDLISAITLAGAAEEILGKLVIAEGGENTLKESVFKQCEMYKFAFSEEASPKEFIRLENQARNELKHSDSALEVSIDLELEATRLLRRAIGNYQKLVPGSRHKYWEFEKEAVRRNRGSTDDYA